MVKRRQEKKVREIHNPRGALTRPTRTRRKRQETKEDPEKDPGSALGGPDIRKTFVQGRTAGVEDGWEVYLWKIQP